MTDLTDEQLADLAAKSEAATPGPWYVFDLADVHSVPRKRPVVTGHFADVDACTRRDAEHIAAADPQTVAALVAEVVRRRAADRFDALRGADCSVQKRRTAAMRAIWGTSDEGPMA